MKKLIKVGVAVIVVVGLIAVAMWYRRQVSIDSCLDRGGRWDYQSSLCEGAKE
jgi:hypothetical protein